MPEYTNYNNNESKKNKVAANESHNLSRYYKSRFNSQRKPQSHKEKNIKWNSLDGLFSILFLIISLVGIYFATSALLKYLGREQFIDLNIANINSLTFSIFYSIQVLLMLGIVWFFAIYLRGSVLKDLGFKYYSILKTVWYSFVALLAIFLLSFVYVLALKFLLGIEAPSSKIEELISNNNVSSNILIVVTAVVAPFCEEIYFRGFLYSAFKKNFGVNIGLFLSALLFALAHLELYSFIPIMLIGWILAYIFEKTGSIFTVIFLHSVYNLILISILLGKIDFVRMY
ncbi:MAG: CPBP family intramembrane metalloprotease [Actinobacteria bacterium]|nr:CPBP family intramembrane metalloprotease [Actinomycetota bacterium]